MYKKLHLTENGFNLLLTDKASFNKKLDAEVFNKKLYNNIIPYSVENIIKINQDR